MSNHLNSRDPHQGLPLHVQIRREMQRTASSAANPSDGESHERTSVGSHERTSLGTSTIIYKELSYSIVGAVIEVHRHLGPGQLESNYERALAKELAMRAIPFRRQVAVASVYKGDVVGTFVVDMIVNDQIVLELKAVERLHPSHTAQVVSYLRATELRLGLLINFNEAVVWRGIKRVVS
jgi:GxxExxY protein